MAAVERTVKCPDCGAERTTRAGTGTTLKCPKGHLFKAPAPSSPPGETATGRAGAGPRVKRAKAAQTVVRKNARPRPKKDPPPAAPVEPAPPTATSTAPASDGVPTDPPSDPATKNPPGGDPAEQARFGRRGGLARYRHLTAGRRAS